MAITTYDELKDALSDYMDRSDLDREETVRLAEDHLNRNLHHRQMIAVSDLSPTSNVCTLPTDYLNYIRVVEKASVRSELTYITPSATDILYPSRAAGPSVHFTIVGDSLTAFPLSTNDIELTYRQSIPALTDANTTNWLLDISPQTYLRTMMVMALQFTNETGTARYQSNLMLSQMSIDALNRESQLGQFYSAQYTVRGCTP